MSAGLQIALQILAAIGPTLLQAAQAIIGIIEKQNPAHPVVPVLKDVVAKAQAMHDSIKTAQATLDQNPVDEV